MRNWITLILFALFCNTCFGQKAQKELTSTDTSLRKSSGKTFKATHFNFPYNITNYDINTNRGELLVFCKNAVKTGEQYTGRLMLFDVNNRKHKWTMDAPYNTVNFLYGENYIIQNLKRKAVCYDRNTGEELWRESHSFCLIDDQQKVALTYSGNVVSLKSGKTLWRSKIEAGYGWRDATYVDKDNYVVAATGVHTFNFADKTGWHYAANTGYGRGASQQDILLEVAAVSMFGIAGGLMVKSGPNGQVSNESSNLVIEDYCIYVASSDTLYSFKTDGTQNWKVKLPVPKTSNSNLFSHGDNLIIVNNGYSFSSTNGLIDRGDPYIASYNKTSGTRNYLTDFNSKTYLSAVSIGKNTATAVCGDTVFQYDISNGNLILKKGIKGLKMDLNNKSINTDKLWTTSRDVFVPFSEVYLDEVFFTWGETKLAQISPKEGSTSLLNDFWTQKAEMRGIQFLSNGNYTVLIKDKKKISALPFSSPNIIGNLIVDIGKSYITLAEVNDILD